MLNLADFARFGLFSRFYLYNKPLYAMAGIRFDCYKIGRYQNNMYIIYPYIFCLISIQLFLNERF